MQMRKSSALILWLHLVTYVKCQDCTLQQFGNSNNFDSNVDLSGFGVAYPGGAQVIVPCNVGYTGFFRLICTEGRWTPRGTKCQPQSCGRPGNSQFADFRLAIGDDFVFGSEVVYECYKGYHLVSRTNRRRCLANGWDGNIPICEATKCPDINVDSNVHVLGNAEHATSGSTVWFTCKSSDETLVGSEKIHCEDGVWIGLVPQCRGALGCSAPPFLTDGDTKSIIRSEPGYGHGERVEYICQDKYTMEGDPFKTCDNGVWKGDMRCLILVVVHDSPEREQNVKEPCTVNDQIMNERNIKFIKVVANNKLYAPHKDHLTFACKSGKRQVGSGPMRVQCNDGEMALPICQ